MKKSFSWTLLFACNLMWSLQFTCIKLVQDQVGTYFTVWGPMLLSTLFLLPFVVRKVELSKARIKELVVTFVPLAVLGAFPAQVLMTWGTQYSQASNAAIITLSLPVLTAFFAFLFLKEKMSVPRWMSFGIAIAGVAICSTEDIRSLDFSSRYAVGNLLIGAAIVGNAYYNVACKKITERFSAIEMIFYSYVIMVVLLTPLVFYYEPNSFSAIPAYTMQTWTGMILLTFFHNFLSMVLFFIVLKQLDAIQVALSNYLITFFGVLVAAVWLGETLRPWVIMGGVLVLAGTVVITFWEASSQPPSLKTTKP